MRVPMAGHDTPSPTGRDNAAAYGAAAGAIAIALFAIGGSITGSPPDFAASGSEVARYFAEESTRLQIGAAISAASTPFLVWFLATVASLARLAGGGAERAGAVAFGCGVAFIAVYLVDLAALTVGALRPETMAAAPEVATALHDLSWMAPAMAASLGAGIVAACSVLVLRYEMLWPRWIGWLAVLAACAYALRTGALFTTEGPFAADGLLGFWVPVLALTGWIAVGSCSLALSLHRHTEPRKRSR